MALEQRQDASCVLGSHRGVLRGMRREFRVAADIRSGQVVEILAVADLRGRGPDVDEIERLAPAFVSDDHVRLEPGSVQPGGDFGHRHRAPGGCVELPGILMGAQRSRGDRVGDLPHPADVQRGRSADEDDLMPPGGSQRADEVKELAWETMVDEQELHETS